MMRRATVLAALAAAALAAAPAHAAVPRVDVMVYGRSTLLAPAQTVTARAATVRAGRRRCRVAAGSAIAALEAVRRRGGPRYGLADYGSCSRRAADAGGLFVDRIGPDRAPRGEPDGWVYKVGRKVGTSGAADPAGPFGTGRAIRPGQRVLWFWCRPTGGQQCQETLEAGPAATTVAPGAPLAVTVTAYDDAGVGRPAEGATVRVGPAGAIAGPDGVATLTAPPEAGPATLVAEAPGLVPAFPREVRVG